LRLKHVPELVLKLIPAMLFIVAWHRYHDLDADGFTAEHLANHDFFGQIQQVFAASENEMCVGRPRAIAVIEKDEFLLESLAWRSTVIVWMSQ